MRILFVLPGLHRYERGAEVALTAVASNLALTGHEITMMGSGPNRGSAPYRFVQTGSIGRERFEAFPSIPVFRSETVYEEATFVPALLRKYRPADYDLTVTCSFPFVNWALRRPAVGSRRPPHVFITQNGDWPAYSGRSEYRMFGCEGLVCTNPDYYERNRSTWRSALIPNGIDVDRFSLGASDRDRHGLPHDRPVVLMVSALIASKRVDDGIRAVAAVPDVHLVVAGDGPLRRTTDALAGELMPGRFTRVTVQATDMPSLYRSADAFLHLSKEESFGNVYLEALACGLPVVAPDTPRVRWIVGEREHLVDSTDLEAVSTGLRQALGAPAHQQEMRVQRAKGFSWSRVGKLYEEFFTEVLDH